MKNLKVVIASVLLALPVLAFAQTKKAAETKDNGIKQYINLWGGIGYSSLHHGYSYDGGYFVQSDWKTPATVGTKVPGGMGGMIGVGYELRKNKFLFSVGPELRILSSRTKFDDMLHVQNVTYQDQSTKAPVNQVRLYNMQNLRQSQLLGQMTIPVLFGMQFNNGVYFLAGGKLGIGLFNSYKQKGDLNMTLSDADAYDQTWANIGNHSLQVNSVQYKDDNTKIKFGVDAAISAEVGMCLDKWMPEMMKTTGKNNITYRLAAFLDYGIMNIGPKDGGSEAFMTYTQNAESKVNDPRYDVTVMNLYNENNNFKKTNLNSLLVGAKFTVGFELNKKEKPVPPVPNPKLFVYVVDSLTGKPMYNQSKPIQCQVWDINPKGNKLLKDGKTDKNGRAYYAEIKPGNFQFKAKADGYFSKTVDWYHEEDNDTVLIKMVKEPIFAVSVRNIETGAPIKARARVEDIETGKVVFETSLDSLKVKAQTKLTPGKNYMVKTNAPGYLSYTGEIDSIDGLTTVYMTPIAKGLSFTLYVYFATNKTEVLPSSEPELLKFYEFMNENPNVHVMIEGHTDNIGSDAHNMTLSDGRAKSVRQSMIDRGIDPSRMEYVGKGFHEPIDTNDTEEGRQHNRRVKVVITSN